MAATHNLSRCQANRLTGDLCNYEDENFVFFLCVYAVVHDGRPQLTIRGRRNAETRGPNAYNRPQHLT